MPSPSVEKEAGEESTSPLQFGPKEGVGVGERNLHFDLGELFLHGDKKCQLQRTKGGRLLIKSTGESVTESYRLQPLLDLLRRRLFSQYARVW